MITLSLLSGCVSDKIEYHFGGEVCEVGIVTAGNKSATRAVFPKSEVGAILITKACYESRIVRARVESIGQVNK